MVSPLYHLIPIAYDVPYKDTKSAFRIYSATEV